MGQPGEASSKLVGLPPCAGSNPTALSFKERKCKLPKER